ncbi:trp RNA-binding attenuation protein MtrB [Desulfofundulus thermosubterraneus]|uniref:Transcription attenuation protein MtrB n=1 Tax=Desulfofundulus thermosubterraneus DSM 16057 TaxID=1121432 RepID=A0A1M6K702_9FIRM|nr:trp RNA-binding attenuation protein MtrB [Desulfofundulus thermosubterraneus]SHJ54759.1 transcription attenuation protein (tryptophan RNA-binding attenuator protein) [Desulfofundulus thermosubterraneus DSM 16057]
MPESWEINADYVAVKALENGVTIIGLTRGKDTRFHHSEKLDKGEIMIAQFTEHTSAIKIRGKVELLTRYGIMRNDDLA